jgi:MFS transporter, FLVCR family, MFS-domain-containing protein 7
MLSFNEPDNGSSGKNTDDFNTALIDEGYKIYSARWYIIALFVFSGVTNAMVLLSWAPITDKANDYWDGIGLTAINLLNVIFQIMYLPGTLLALRISEKYLLRSVLLAGGVLTTVGCLIRFIGVVSRDTALGAAGSYTLVLLGTALVGLAQPFYLNMPAKIAATWFAVSERDIATTLCSLANPLGSAIGSFIPAMFVSSDSDDAISKGINKLLFVQLILTAAALTLTYGFFKDEPPTAPTASAKTMQMNKKSNQMFIEVTNLFQNKEYVKIFTSFTIILGSLNALAALLNQLPGGYSNGEIGLTGAALIMSGFFGAFVTGFVLDYTKAYGTILKGSYYMAFICWIAFISNCRSNNLPFFVLTAALLGFFTLPTSKSFLISPLVVQTAYHNGLLS